MTNRKLLSIDAKVGDLDDLELLLVPIIFLEFCTTTLHFLEATMAKRMKVDPHCQRRNCCVL